MHDPKDDKAQEGRQHDKEGKDVGDEAFHDVAWNLTAEKEAAALEHGAAMLVDIEEAQVKDIAAKSPELGMKAYDELLARYPDNERTGEWREAKDRLRKD